MMEKRNDVKQSVEKQAAGDSAEIDDIVNTGARRILAHRRRNRPASPRGEDPTVELDK